MTKTKEPAAMEEIHRIREKIHSETEAMSIQKLMRHISKEAKLFERKHNLKLRAPKGKKTAVSARA